uniref:Uncharacterized protein n=1 Tax=Astyanax mexicanus TaxID=7994 RepID=A0A3B1ITI2_ASTMX
MWHIYTMEYYAGDGMKLETIILSKLLQGQKTKHRMFSLIRWELNNENTWTQEGEHHTLGACCRVVFQLGSILPRHLFSTTNQKRRFGLST